MEDGYFHKRWYPGRGIVQEALKSGRPSLMLGYARSSLIGNAGGETVSRSDADRERAHSDQDDRRKPALARILRIGHSQHRYPSKF